MTAATSTVQSSSVPYDQVYAWADKFYKNNIKQITDLTPEIGTRENSLGLESDRFRASRLTVDAFKTKNNETVEFYISALKTKFLAEHILFCIQQTINYCTYTAWTESDFTRYRGENKDPQVLIDENNRASARIEVLNSHEVELQTQIHAIDKALEGLQNKLDQAIMRETTGNTVVHRLFRSVWSSTVSYSYLEARMVERNKTAELSFETEKVKRQLSVDHPLPFETHENPNTIGSTSETTAANASAADLSPSADLLRAENRQRYEEETKEAPNSLTDSQLSSLSTQAAAVEDLVRPHAPSPSLTRSTSASTQADKAVEESQDSTNQAVLPTRQPEFKNTEASRKREEEFPPLGKSNKPTAAASAALPPPPAPRSQARGSTGRRVLGAQNN